MSSSIVALDTVTDRYPLKQGLKLPSTFLIRSASMVTDRYPLKQGLKHCSNRLNREVNDVTDRYPLKQGLKQEIIRDNGRDLSPVTDRYPLKQGLKHRRTTHPKEFSTRHRPISTKTRIETQYTNYYAKDERVTDRYPLKQGLKPNVFFLPTARIWSQTDIH